MTKRGIVKTGYEVTVKERKYGTMKRRKDY